MLFSVKFLAQSIGILLLLLLPSHGLSVEGDLIKKKLTESRLVDVKAGAGQFNGVSFPVLVVQSHKGVAIEEAIRGTFSPQFTVAQINGPMGPLLIVTDAQTPQCPGCKKVTFENIQETIQDSLVFMTIPQEGAGNLVLGIPAGRLYAGINAAPVYEGILRNDFESVVTTVSASKFHFSGQTVRSVVGRSKLEPRVTSNALIHSLQNQGFHSPEGKVEEEIDAKGRVFLSDSAAIHISMRKNSVSTEVVINEIEKSSW